MRMTFIELEHITQSFVHEISFVIGLLGVIIVIIGLIDSLGIYVQNRKNFAKIRYVMGKHIVLGLDFLVVKDILETVFLKGSDVETMDIILLVVIVGIRMLLTSHTAKGIQEMREEMAIERLARKRLERRVDDLSEDELEAEERLKEAEKREKDLILKEKKLSILQSFCDDRSQESSEQHTLFL